MSEKNKDAKKTKKTKKEKRREKKRLKGCEHASDKRTAAFIARQLGEVQETLCDLMADMRTFEHYLEMEYANFCARALQRLKRKYETFAEDGVWSESDD